jgi:hypothetical protein
MGNTVDSVNATYTCRMALPREFFGGVPMGDLGIEWPVENIDRVAETFQVLIDKGVNFYLVEKKDGLVRSKTTVTPVSGGDTLKQQIASGKVYIKNADIKPLLDAGIASIATLTGVGDFKAPSGKTAKTGKEAASNDTVALGQRQGG